MKQLQYIWKNSVFKICSSRTAVFALIILLVCRSYARPLNRFMDAVDYPVSWCVFPFFMANYYFLFLFWVLIVYLNSDVPFMQQINMYQVIRTGRSRWAVGQMGAIFLRSLLAVFYTAVCTILPLLPEIELTNEWGKLLWTVAMTDMASEYELRISVFSEIFTEYTPLQLMLLSILLCTLISCFMGMLMFLISLYSGKVLAVAGAMAMTALLFVVVKVHPKFRFRMAFFVPTIWAQVARIATPSLSFYWMPSLSYMLGFLSLTLGVMALLILHKVKRVEFQWENDDV